MAAQQDKFTEDLAEGIGVITPKVSDSLKVRLQVSQQPDHLDIAVRFGLQPTARPHPEPETGAAGLKLQDDGRESIGVVKLVARRRLHLSRFPTAR